MNARCNEVDLRGVAKHFRKAISSSARRYFHDVAFTVGADSRLYVVNAALKPEEVREPLKVARDGLLGFIGHSAGHRVCHGGVGVARLFVEKLIGE